MTDERREFVDEMRAETRDERELMAMAAILEGEAMDRYTQMFDCDDFEETAAGIIDRALDAEMDQEAGDWERVKGEASEFIEEAIAERMIGSQCSKCHHAMEAHESDPTAPCGLCECKNYRQYGGVR